MESTGKKSNILLGKIKYVILELFHLRWLMVLQLGILSMFEYFAYNLMGYVGTGGEFTIQTRFNNAGGKFNETENQLMDSISSWIGALMTIGGGILMDRVLGARLTFFIAQVISLCSYLVLQIGVIKIKFSVLILHSIMSGVVGSNFSVVQNVFCAQWFKGHTGLALALGLSLAAGTFFSALQSEFIGAILKSIGLINTLWIGVVSLVIGLFFTLTTIYQDHYGEKHGIYVPDTDLTDPRFANESIWKTMVSAILLPLQLSLKFWIISAVTLFSYGGGPRFKIIAKNYFQAKYNIPMGEAAQIIGIYFWILTFGLFVFGFLLDVVGRYGFVLLFSASCFTILHILILTTMISARLFMVCLGVSSCIMISTIWPAIQLIVPSRLLGTANSAIFAVENVFLGLLSLAIGKIVDAYRPKAPRVGVHPDHVYLSDLKGYELTECVYLPFAIMAVVSTAVLCVIDYRTNRVLVADTAERIAIQQKEQAAHEKEVQEYLSGQNEPNKIKGDVV